MSKELQWRFLDGFGPEKYFCLFGPLHLEKLIILLCGSLIEGSGLDKIMALCGLSIVGMDSLVSVNHIKRARYCIQVAVYIMFSLLASAHKESGDKDPVLQWLKNQREESKMCHYWHIIIDLMLNLLIFVRSVREGNFSLYVSSLKQVVKWYYMPVIITVMLIGSQSTSMIWLTYQLHHPISTNVLQMAILLFKSQTKNSH